MTGVTLGTIGWLFSVFILIGAVVAMMVSHNRFGNSGFLPAVIALTVCSFTAVIWYGWLIDDAYTGVFVIGGTFLLVIIGWRLSAKHLKAARRLLWFSLIWALFGGLLVKGISLISAFLLSSNPIWLTLILMVIAAVIAARARKKKQQEPAAGH